MSPLGPAAPRRTKIVATIGPGSESERTIDALIRAGVDVFRLNFSHGTARIHSEVAQRIREASERQRRYVGVLVDLQGPKIRIDSFREDGVDIEEGASFRLDPSIGDDDGDEHGVSYSYAPLPESLAPDDILLLDDGRIRLRVRSVAGARIDCEVASGGHLGSRKGINRLGGGIAAPALTEKDIADIRTLGHINPDFVAVSFVSQTRDIEHTRQLLDEQGLKADIIAKIERAEVVHDDEILAGILEASNGVMVARGDLGVEVGDAELIGIQKELISRARRGNRLVITATQMMESMINSSMPTRAEVFDVANAVLDGTDAVMLSAETAVGKYPVEVVRAMAAAALGAERHPVARNSRYRFDREFGSAQETIAMAAMYAANHYPRVRGIACLTESGNTPRLMSRLSSGLPIFALSTRFETLRKLTLCRGVVPLYFHAGTEDGNTVEARALEFLTELGHVQTGDSLLLSRGDALGEPGSTNMMKIITLGTAP